jgi:hypothetical protein
MKRIYLIAPDIAAARRVVNDLLIQHIQDRHLHIIARRGTPLEDLPEGSLLQKSDFVPAVQRGLALGGTTGILAGLVAIALPGTSLVIAGGVLLGSALAGAAVGSWLGGMVGMNVGNTRLKQFEEAIERGELLILVDVPRDRLTAVEEHLRTQFTDVKFKGLEPLMPAFP